MVLVTPLAVCVLVHTAASRSNVRDYEVDYHALIQTASPKYIHRSFAPLENLEPALERYSSLLLLQQRARPHTSRERLSEETRRQSATPLHLLNDDYGFYRESDSGVGAGNTASFSRQHSQHPKAPEKPLEEIRRTPGKQVPLVSDDPVADGSWARAVNMAFQSSQQSQKAQAPDKNMDELQPQSELHMQNLFGDYAASSDEELSGGGRSTGLFSTGQSQQTRPPGKVLEEFRQQEGDTAHLFGNVSVADKIGIAGGASISSVPLWQRPHSPEELEFGQQAIRQVHLSSDDGGDMSNDLTRPNLGKGPDIVHFGILVKQFYGVNLQASTFTIDMISSISWLDHRASAKVPTGVASFTLSESQAKKAIWVPRVEVTNTDIKGTEDISTSFSIRASGEVHRVCRQLVRVKQKFTLTNFPFDSHHLDIRIASGKYMSDEVMLVPSANASISGITSKPFDGENYYLKGWRLSSFEDDNGELKKSRGLLSIKVKRDANIYWNDQMLPCILLMLLSCSVFWFPFISQFVTPRLALSILALLNLQNLTNRSNSVLPSGHPETWDDIMNQNMMMAMVANCVLNVWTEIHFHVTKVTELAKLFNTELKYATILISGTLIFFIYISASKDLMSHGVVNVLCKICLISTVVVYVGFCEYRVRQESMGEYRDAQEPPPEIKPQNK